jgi:hypothetical protein
MNKHRTKKLNSNKLNKNIKVNCKIKLLKLMNNINNRIYK